MNLKRIFKVKDSSEYGTGDPFDNGSVTGKVLEVHSDHYVIETVNEDGDVENVEVLRDDV